MSFLWNFLVEFYLPSWCIRISSTFNEKLYLCWEIPLLRLSDRKFKKELRYKVLSRCTFFIDNTYIRSHRFCFTSSILFVGIFAMLPRLWLVVLKNLCCLATSLHSNFRSLNPSFMLSTLHISLIGCFLDSLCGLHI